MQDSITKTNCFPSGLCDLFYGQQRKFLYKLSAKDVTKGQVKEGEGFRLLWDKLTLLDNAIDR